MSIEGIRKGSASLSDITMVVINVTDINDHVPMFSQDPYIADIREDAAVGEMVIMVRNSMGLHYCILATASATIV